MGYGAGSTNQSADLPTFPAFSSLGANRLAFLRIREEERVNDDDSNLTRAEREVQLMNEADGAIEVRTGDGQMLEVDVQGKGG